MALPDDEVTFAGLGCERARGRILGSRATIASSGFAKQGRGRKSERQVASEPATLCDPVYPVLLTLASDGSECNQREGNGQRTAGREEDGDCRYLAVRSCDTRQMLSTLSAAYLAPTRRIRCLSDCCAPISLVDGDERGHAHRDRASLLRGAVRLRDRPRSASEYAIGCPNSDAQNSPWPGCPELTQVVLQAEYHYTKNKEVLAKAAAA
eukprot:1038876-Rhodomonas_salina.1